MGTNQKDSTLYRGAFQLARQAWDIGTELGFNFELLHVTPGLPGRQNKQLFMRSAAAINEAVDEFFPSSDPQFAAMRLSDETGRMFVEGAFTLVTEIIGKRRDSDSSRSYYINDGFYQNLVDPVVRRAC